MKFEDFLKQFNELFHWILRFGGMSFILIGLFIKDREMFYFGSTMYGLFWLVQLASWMGYLNRRIDKYFDEYFVRIHNLMAKYHGKKK